MNKNLFYYNLPPDLIAQSPILKRDESSLYFINRKTGEQKDLKFKDIKDIIKKDMVLVLNETKVISARFFARKEETNAKIEVFYLNHNKNEMTALVKPVRRLKEGIKLIADNSFYLVVKKILDDGIVVFLTNLSDSDLIEKLEKIGDIPIPPYIKEKLTDKNRYQTVYATKLESSAAPTAGLHFTNDLLVYLQEKGVEILKISLKIGLGTFRPIKTDNILDHKMHYESYEISPSVAEKLNHAIENKKEIIAVGTTVVRTLESNYLINKNITPGLYDTNLFIYPGYKFNVVNHLITNFHLPESSLICLVSAFYDRKKIIDAYNDAVLKKYRFFSFGDAMLIW